MNGWQVAVDFIIMALAVYGAVSLAVDVIGHLRRRRHAHRPYGGRTYTDTVWPDDPEDKP